MQRSGKNISVILPLAGLAAIVFVSCPVDTLTAPKPPTSLGVIDATSDSLTLDWEQSLTATSYQLWRAGVADGIYEQVYDGGDNQHIDQGLTVSSTYYYKVRARNSIGFSAFTGTVSGTTLVAGSAPATPTGLQVDDPTVSSLHLAWDSSSGATGYKVYRGTSSSGSFSTVNEAGNVSAWTDTNLSSGTTYYYRVSAYNTFGESSRTDPPAAGTTLVPGSSPPTPTGLQAGSPTLSSLHLSWNPSSGATGYKVLSDTSSSGPFSAVDDVGNATGWTDMGLSSGTTYYYKVTAYNSFGQSPPTGAVQGTTGSLPAVPTGLSATNPTLSTIDLAWDAASDATGHKLFRDTSSTGPFDRVIDVGNATSWTYDGLTSGITYYFKASSYNSFGESAKSTAVWATTGNIPSTPTGLHSENATLTSVDLEWSTSVGATGYRLYRDAAINGSYATQHDVGSATAYTDMGLSSGTTYYYKVSAYNEFGESPLSSAVTGSACRNYYRDQDGDGYGIDDVICSATPTGPYTALQSGDCDDGAASVYPGAVEICDTKDNDCDGQVDEAGASGCVTYYLDVDGDTYGVTADSKCLCAPEGFYSASTGGDCIDSNSAVHPGASEVCDGLDNDCNGRTDSADSGLVLTLCELQLGVCAGKKHSASQCVGGSWLSCGLANYGSYYGTERCDTRDNDCDGYIDEESATGCSVYYADGDGDGYGTTSKCLCAPSGIYTATAGGDCDDSNSAVKPGAQEICDGIDNDCDGLTDGADPSLLLTSCELQLGVCTGKKHAASQCVAGSWLACDASNYGSSFGTEICDSKDNDCNGLVDDNASGCTYYYYDGDADGYGVESNTMCLCAPTGLYTATVAGDCNDAVATVHPGASEICDSWDNDCDTVVDECGPVSPDPFEPNNTMETAYYYGVADNVDGVSGWACFTVTWDLYPPDTEDWSSMTIHDGPAIIELAPRAKISMTASPNVNYDLCIYYDKGSDGSIEYAKCSTNLGNLQDEVRLPEVETGGDDSGTVYFRVIWVSGISCAKFSFCYSY